MTIGSVSSAGTYQTSTTNNAATIKELEKKITDAQKQITEIQSDDSLDEETKNKQLSVYQTQVQNLQSQISILQREKTGQSGQQQEQVQSLQNQQDESVNKARGVMGVGQYLDEDA